jgi:hypothetical protein
MADCVEPLVDAFLTAVEAADSQIAPALPAAAPHTAQSMMFDDDLDQVGAAVLVAVLWAAMISAALKKL